MSTPEPPDNASGSPLPTGDSLTQMALGFDTPAFETTLERDVVLAAIEASVFGRSDVEPGRPRLGAYELEHKLGAGGMGVVYAARHVKSGEGVALKYLHRATATHLYRFKQEFRALAGAEHPNLVTLHELVVLPDGSAFFTMERVANAASFVDYVRRGIPPGALPNIARLTRALRQLVAAIVDLHARGCLHRDLKPSNILVNPEGRVVVVDFGLVAELDMADGPTLSGQLLGTVAYMAPEQAASRGVGPPADAYAIGVVLYESLTGARLFEGSILGILAAKAKVRAPKLPANTPVELRELCTALLQIEPDDRPALTEVLERLDGEVPPARTRVGRDVVRFVGREAQLEQLARCLGQIDESVRVHIRGHSGYGKSAFVDHFIADHAREGSPWILRGRCFASESMPHKGVDGLIDSLALRLNQLPAPARAQFRPRHIGALTEMFPVLDDLWGAVSLAPATDPVESRRRGVAALRDLLTRIGDERQLILFIDDFQWADMDSVRLIEALTRRPDSPRMLLIVAFRPEPANPVLAALASAAHAGEVAAIDIGPLMSTEAHELARALLHAHAHDVERATSYARASEGNPLFMAQAIAHTGQSDESVGGRTVDEVVARRILALDATSRRMLAAIAVAGRPVRIDAALAVAGCEGLEDRLQQLRDHELVELVGFGPQDTVTAAHDRIREVMLGELDPAELAELHRALALDLEARGCKPQILADHYERGGDIRMALHHVERAATEAVEALAFERAVELYRRALALLGPEAEPARRTVLERALAEHLGNIGRSSEAAEMFERLVAHATTQDQADVFRCQAIEQLLHSGEVEAGLVELRVALANVGIRLPRRTLALVVAIVWNRAIVTLRRPHPTLRDPSDLDASTRARLAILLSSTLGMLFEDTLHSSLFGPLLLRAASEAGAPEHLGWALFIEITSCVSMQRDARAHACIEELHALASATDIPLLAGLAAHADAAACYLRLRWAEAELALTRALTLSEQTPHLIWLHRKILGTYAYVRLQRGEFAELHRQLGAWLADASQRGNRYEVAFLTGIASIVERIVGDPATCHALMAEGNRSRSTSGYHYADGMLDVAEASIDLYEGRIEAATCKAERTQQLTRRQFLDKNPLVGPVLLELVASCLVRTAIDRPHDRRARRRALDCARKLARASYAASRGYAAVIMAALHTLDGDWDAARATWTRAHAELGQVGRAGVCAAIALRLADAGGPELRADAERYFGTEGIREPERFVDLFAPAARRQPADLTKTHARP